MCVCVSWLGNGLHVSLSPAAFLATYHTLCMPHTLCASCVHACEDPLLPIVSFAAHDAHPAFHPRLSDPPYSMRAGGIMVQSVLRYVRM